MQLTPEQRAEALKEIERLKVERQNAVIKAHEIIAFCDGRIAAFEGLLNGQPGETGAAAAEGEGGEQPSPLI